MAGTLDGVQGSGAKRLSPWGQKYTSQTNFNFSPDLQIEEGIKGEIEAAKDPVQWPHLNQKNKTAHGFLM